MLNTLAPQLRTDLVLWMFRDTIREVPFFHDKPSSFIVAVVEQLQKLFFEPKDVIFRQGDRGDEMWFVLDGELEARQEQAVTRRQAKPDVLGLLTFLEAERDREMPGRAKAFTTEAALPNVEASSNSATSRGCGRAAEE